ncbi:hypothetical protein DFA_06172 [Cavenderia fasciculata]|uniref:Uncharacterized protein n=1 Tax=Cavenderia fasciculata TaxID=261658 RepID=F4PKB0_CACFS|nr:uncharacterized protein DFA_06172 [Cavenderia fasciculata]EGG24034.1 hypothetical protein DFA_06172 [Cavenderia fasciculata]|eukprot:XP_004361885.1 hypothetical protein DFA_06172 [Cavenderia fasciculata]
MSKCEADQRMDVGSIRLSCMYPNQQWESHPHWGQHIQINQPNVNYNQLNQILPPYNQIQPPYNQNNNLTYDQFTPIYQINQHNNVNYNQLNQIQPLYNPPYPNLHQPVNFGQQSQQTQQTQQTQQSQQQQTKRRKTSSQPTSTTSTTTTSTTSTTSTTKNPRKCKKGCGGLIIHHPYNSILKAKHCPSVPLPEPITTVNLLSTGDTTIPSTSTTTTKTTTSTTTTPPPPTTSTTSTTTTPTPPTSYLDKLEEIKRDPYISKTISIRRCNYKNGSPSQKVKDMNNPTPQDI